MGALFRLVLAVALLSSLGGCTALAVGGAVVGAGAAVASTAVGTGVAVGKGVANVAAAPFSSDDKDKK
jgi:hypothetical protein